MSLPKSLIKIGDYGFYSSQLRNFALTIPPNVKVIGNFSFAGTGENSINKLELPNGLKEIGTSAFEYNSIKEVRIPKTVNKMGENVFDGCILLQKVYLPNNLKKINKGMFKWCLSLSKVNFPKSATSIEKLAFSETELVYLKIPDQITSIGTQAFYKCTSLKKVILPTRLKEIKPGLFMGCYKLKKVEIPNSITAVSMSAFSNTSMKEIILPENLRVIKCRYVKDGWDYDTLFEINNKLQKIVITSESVESIQRKSFSGLNKTCVIEIPASKEIEYRKMLIDSGVKDEQIVVGEAEIEADTYIGDDLAGRAIS